MAKKDIALNNSNLYLKGAGNDTNGNLTVKLTFPNQRGFSIQTNGNLPATHGIFMYGKNIKDLTAPELEIIELESIAYIQKFGSKKQKDLLLINNSAKDKVETFVSKQKMKTGGELNSLDQIDKYDVGGLVEASYPHYIMSMLWSTQNPATEEEEYLDENYSIENISPELEKRSKSDLKSFIEANKADIESTGMTPEMLGHDLWLTREGHGAGFWDRGYGEAGERLSKSARKMGEVYLDLDKDKITAYQTGGKAGNPHYLSSPHLRSEIEAYEKNPDKVTLAIAVNKKHRNIDQIIAYDKQSDHDAVLGLINSMYWNGVKGKHYKNGKEIVDAYQFIAINNESDYQKFINAYSSLEHYLNRPDMHKRGHLLNLHEDKIWDMSKPYTKKFDLGSKRLEARRSILLF
jgi:hypothetical protein